MEPIQNLRKKCAEAPLYELLGEAQAVSWKHFGKKVELYYTYYQDRVTKHQFTKDAKERYKEEFIKKIKNSLNPATPILGLSGFNCELRCEHCKGINLMGMHNVSTTDKLYEAVKLFHSQGTKGILLSAGSRKDGTTLIGPEFNDVIMKIKKEFGLYIGLHAGYVSRDRVREIKGLGVDSILIDVIGDEETLLDVYHLKIPLSIIEDVVRFTIEEGIDVIPHICIGLNFCKIKGEFDAIDMLAKYPIKYVTYIILEPTPGTPMADLDPPDPAEVLRVLAYSRFRLPRVLHSLGCIRPIGRYGEQIESLALQVGCNRIAGISSELTLVKCDEAGIEFNLASYCCMIGNGMFDHLKI